MDTEADTMKTKEGCTSQSSSPLTIEVKVECDWEAAEVKLENELILSDHDDGAYSQEVAKKNSTPRLISENNAMVLKRTVQIILERCDADDLHKLNPEQSSKSSAVSKNCSDVPPIRIKVENEFDMRETGEMETFITATDCSNNAGVVSGKQLVDFQANASGKVKEEKGFVRITGELVVGYRSTHSGSRGVVKCEEGELQTDFDHCSSVGCRNEGISNSLKKETRGVREDNTVKTAVEEPLGDYSRSNVRVKMEAEKEEKVRIPDELVRNLQGQCKCVEKDEKPLMKIVKCEESDAHLGSETQSDFEHPSVSNATNAVTDKTVTVVFEAKNKVSAKVNAKNNSSVKRYSCSECSYRCNHKTNMTKHIRVHTGERPHECKKCLKKFKTQSHLNVHMVTHTNKRLFKCVHCTARFKTKTHLINHLRRHSDERPYSCTECPAKFKIRRNLTDHLVIHSSERRFECGHCNLRFKSKDLLKCHIRSHFDSAYSCTLCEAKLSQSCNLKSHLRMKHSSERPFECTQCGARFKSKGTLRRHLFIHSGEKAFPCTHCPSTFSRSSTLKSHIIAKHTNEKSYTCAHCSMKFNRKWNVANHLITHSDEKPHSCPQCPLTFKRTGSLKVHLLSHTGQKPHRCPQCPANFCQQNELKLHLAVHFDERPFACDQCPAKFKRSKDLKKHKKTHVTVRLYGCAQCSLKFKTQETMKQHVKYVHMSIEKRHACSQCPYRTHKLSNLKGHLFVHSNERPFSCDQCHLKFKTPSYFDRHNAMVHSNVEPSFVKNVQ